MNRSLTVQFGTYAVTLEVAADDLISLEHKDFIHRYIEPCLAVLRNRVERETQRMEDMKPKRRRKPAAPVN